MTKVMGNTDGSTMDTFYTNTNFIRIAVSTVLLLVTIPHIALGGHKKGISGIFSTLIILNALLPLLPYNFDRNLTRLFSLFLLPPTLVWIVYIITDYRRPNLSQYRNWIIDTLRESVLIYDDTFRLQGYRGSIANLSESESQSMLNVLRAIVEEKHTQKKEGYLPFQEQVYRYRIRPVHKGYLITLLDFTEEQRLLDELMNKNTILEQKRSLLENMETLNVKAYREQFRQQVAIHIQGIVHESLSKLRNMIAVNTDITSLLSCAEDALAEIRHAVRKLVEKEGIQ